MHVWVSVTSFYPLGTRDQTQVIRLGSWCLYSLSYLLSFLKWESSAQA